MCLPNDDDYEVVRMMMMMQDENAIEKKAPPSPLPRFRVHFFCKTLTLRTQDLRSISLSRVGCKDEPQSHLLQSVWSMFCFIDVKEDSLLDLQRVKSQSVSEESLKNAPVPTIVYENSVHCVLFIVDVE
ncbi:hypothetical protein DY000_02061342 [Brassica cretica]|uniref:Uncharacterized protein n=1 Tax=Brassica cretica TaxID=69181 RepID=A0ABQ7AN66_BRACR|nr:hypothetical protein DY000_02061342 [Brassica cretica]